MSELLIIIACVFGGILVILFFKHIISIPEDEFKNRMKELEIKKELIKAKKEGRESVYDPRITQMEQMGRHLLMDARFLTDNDFNNLSDNFFERYNKSSYFIRSEVLKKLYYPVLEWLKIETEIEFPKFYKKIIKTENGDNDIIMHDLFDLVCEYRSLYAKQPQKKIQDDLIFNVKGTNYVGDSNILAAYRLNEGDLLMLSHEKDNQYDPFAIKVMTINNNHIGYVEKKFSQKVFDILHQKDCECCVYDIDKDETSSSPFIVAKLTIDE